MQFFIMGGTGFVGRHLIARLLAQGHEVTALARSQKSLERLPAECTGISGDPLNPGDWQRLAREADVLVNLVGRSIMTRWSDSAKKSILDTRVLSTRMAVASLAPDRPATLINANAVGFYPMQGDQGFAEDGPAGSGFLAEVCKNWQAEAEKARDKGARVVIARFATVLGADDGAMARMLPAFRLGLGGRLGSGRQWFSWIHVLDLCRALEFMALREDLSGPVNCCAPQAVTNAQFTRTLGRVLRRPTLLPMPGAMIQWTLGEVAQVLLHGAKIVPKALEKADFSFRFPDLEQALRDIVLKRAS